MANGKKGPRLDHKVTKKLLDGLTTDDNFRAAFEADPGAALESIGYVAPAEDADTAAAGTCLTLQAGQTLASAEDIERDRAKLEAALSVPFGFTGVGGLTR